MKYGEKLHPGLSASELPRDPHLPGFSELLDPARVRELLRREVPGLSTAGACHIHYLRYKPETNCIVSYGLTRDHDHAPENRELVLYGKCFTDSDFAPAAQKIRTGKWVDVPGLAPALAIPELRAIFYFFPNDTRLDGLRTLADPKKIQRLLYRYLSRYASGDWRISDRRLRMELVRFKPEKRVVVRLSTRAVHKPSGERKPLTVYLRSYSDARGSDVQRLMLALFRHHRAGGGPRVPEPYGYDEERRLLFIEGLPGTPLELDLDGPAGPDAAGQTARSLARLQACPDADVPERTLASLLQEARATGHMLTRVLPESRPLTEDILTRLLRLGGALPAARPQFVHGDFYHGQVLTEDGQATIIDFDRAYIGDPAADVGNFCAHLRLLQKQGRIASVEGLERGFLDAYRASVGGPLAADRLAFWTVLGLFQLAVRPFRSLEPNWRNSIQDTLELCRSLLP